MSVKKLTDEIIANNYLPFVEWNEPSRNYNTINKIRNLLLTVSGSNIVEMLKDILKPLEIEAISEVYVDVRPSLNSIVQFSVLIFLF